MTYIRKATINDLDEIAKLEKLCFPINEACSKESFKRRLNVFSDYFFVAIVDGKIVSMVNGMVTKEANLDDVMYEDENIHNEDGDWQMIFGVLTHPDYQKKGLASDTLKAFIKNAKSKNKKGLVLTCKDSLIKYYSKFGFKNEGISSSNHGDVVWYQMRLTF